MAPVPVRVLLERRQNRRRASQERKETLPDRSPVTPEELEGLSTLIKEKFNWTHEPRPFQMEAIEAQLKKKDVLVHAGTGLGKTAIAAGPHAHPSAKGKVTLMVSPLIALHEEMAETFRDEFNLKATAINSSNGASGKPWILKNP